MSSERNFVSVEALPRREALSRREALRRIALGVTAAGLTGAFDRADAHEVHAQAAAEKTLQGEYTVRYCNAHEFRTLERLSALIVPADDGGPSGREGGAPEFIDLLCNENEELAAIFSGGILWLDHAMLKRCGKRFVEAPEEEQTAMLDALVEAENAETAGDTAFATNDYRRFSMYGVRKPADIRRGLRFFDWARKLIVDAYYTSPAGIEDLGYIGNASYSEYEVPQEAVEYALSRSPFRA